MTWTDITGFEIFFFGLVISFYGAKYIVPKINEGFIYAYTLFHWYLLVDTLYTEGPGFWTICVILISFYPTFLIIKSSFEYKILLRKHKKILYYWFLFTIAFTYIDQVALGIVKPVLLLETTSWSNLLIILISGAQLYFLAVMLSLLVVATPLFHLDRSNDSFKRRWVRARSESREILKYKLDNYIEYQISMVQVVYITIFSMILFWIDASSSFRPQLVFIYTVVLPVVFFYVKWAPEKNIEENPG